MNHNALSARPLAAVSALAAAAGLVIATPVAASADAHGHHGSPLATEQVNLVSDVPGEAVLTDPDAVDSWGLALSPTSPLWAANALSSTATLYTDAPDSSAVAKVPTIRVTVPGPGNSPVGLPTGQVFNGGSGFVLSNGTTSGPATFIFDTITGEIAAWNPSVDPHLGNAEIKATVPGASYTGLAIATTHSGAQQLYAANFAQGRIDVFDSSFGLVKSPSWAFKDAGVQKQGYAPFNAQTLNGDVYVTYAKADPKTGRALPGKGIGFVDEFTPEGRLVARIDSRTDLNDPWGLAIAPASWGDLAGDLLIGNFGGGQITVIKPDHHGRFRSNRIVGQLTDGATGKVITIPGLWALTPGTATTGGTDALWFSAGINDEADGLIGVFRHVG
jgi:uncharacterized protein (TIGR03118 family)